MQMQQLGGGLGLMQQQAAGIGQATLKVSFLWTNVQHRLICSNVCASNYLYRVSPMRFVSSMVRHTELSWSREAA